MRCVVILFLACSSACVGLIGDSRDGDERGVDPDDIDTGVVTVARLEARRLTRAEYTQTLRDLIDPAVPVPIAYFAVDEGVPFDNDIELQHVTPVVIEGADLVAESVAAWVMANATVKRRVYGCAAKGPADTACFTSLVEGFGRRALRRPLSPDEKTAFMALQSFSIDEASFDSGAELVLRALLSHPAMLYRFEPGITLPGNDIATLSSYEIATRIAYLVTGSTPDDALLEAAEKSTLLSAAARIAETDRLLATPRAVAHWQRFHAMWLGYARFGETDALSTAMRAESDALVAAAVDDGHDYRELFSSARTWLDNTLAAHYGLPAPATASGAWVTYPTPQRRGILSHASVLAYGAKNGDTSPTRRGIYIRSRLFCQEIPPPPPDVNVDQPPQGASPDACKTERYEMHRTGSCAVCHVLTDPVGFGLESYDSQGRFRTHDLDRPECPISGVGAVDEIGAFSGPAELASLVLDSGELETCVAKYVYTYALGRRLRAADRPLASVLGEALQGGGMEFADIVRALVADETFVQRREVEL